MKQLRIWAVGAAIGLGILGATLGASADTLKQRTGYGAFNNRNGTQSCVGESFGGTFNNCSSALDFMIFDLFGASSTGTVNLTAWSDGSGSSFSCYIVALDLANNSTDFTESTAVSFSSGVHSQASSITLPSSQFGFRYQCENVPIGRGIGGFTW